MIDDGPGPYRVNPSDGRFEVLDGAERIVMVCQDKPSAETYTAALNEAYRRGYKAGYRDARRP